MSYMGFREGEVMGVQDTNNRRRCRGCACDQLAELQTGTLVDVFLPGSTTPLDGLMFVNFDDDTCCAFFTQTTAAGPRTIVIDCEDIVALRFLP